MSTATAAADALDIFTMAAELGNALNTYLGDDGEVSITGFYDYEQTFIGDESTVFTPDPIAHLLVAEVGEPKRGDIVTDEDGQEWKLVNEIAGDFIETSWRIERV